MDITKDTIQIDIILPLLKENLDLKDISFQKTLHLYGKSDALLDSLALVNFVFSLENKVLSEFNFTLKITMEDILNEERSPFEDIDHLAEFILLKINGES